VTGWVPLAADASPAAQLFAVVLFAVFFLRLCRWCLHMVGLGS